MARLANRCSLEKAWPNVCHLGWNVTDGWRHVVKISGIFIHFSVDSLLDPVLGLLKRLSMRWSFWLGTGLGLDGACLETFNSEIGLQAQTR